MRPLTLENHDPRTLQDLGLASIQIVHDLKNQLNGLKLYATFLRKRLESSERPTDELEAIALLISGLERTASELTILVRYGQPVELKKQPSVALAAVIDRLLADNLARAEVNFEVEDATFEGEFDVGALTEALKSITDSALKMRSNGGRLTVSLTLAGEGSLPYAVIEWRNIKTAEHDMFSTLSGGDGLRMSLAARIVEAHQGKTEQRADLLRVSLPIH